MTQISLENLLILLLICLVPRRQRLNQNLRHLLPKTGGRFNKLFASVQFGLPRHNPVTVRLIG